MKWLASLSVCVPWAWTMGHEGGRNNHPWARCSAMSFEQTLSFNPLHNCRVGFVTSPLYTHLANNFPKSTQLKQDLNLALPDSLLTSLCFMVPSQRESLSSFWSFWHFARLSLPLFFTISLWGWQVWYYNFHCTSQEPGPWRCWTRTWRPEASRKEEVRLEWGPCIMLPHPRLFSARQTWSYAELSMDLNSKKAKIKTYNPELRNTHRE